MIYRSKKDWWLVSLVAAGMLLPFVLAIYNFVGGNSHEAWHMLFAGAVTTTVVLLLTYPLYYEITPSELKVRCGILVRKQIPLSAIEEVRPTRNPLSAPAWSLDRLHVGYRKGGAESFVLISPEDKATFMRELAESDARLVVQGERVVRGR
ncbi:MAG: PH domain-containing protein [Pyrinomonadaceae bacterium]|nr:PH domain-containing protein [Pyrinomonadaceae bacterium]